MPLPIGPTTPTTTGGPPAPRNVAEAAEQFEAVLVRQFVQVMTKELFRQEGGGMSAMQADAQRDALTDALTRQLTTTDALGLRDVLTRSLGGNLAAPEAHAALDAARVAPVAIRPPSPLD